MRTRVRFTQTQASLYPLSIAFSLTAFHHHNFTPPLHTTPPTPNSIYKSVHTSLAQSESNPDRVSSSTVAPKVAEKKPASSVGGKGECMLWSRLTTATDELPPPAPASKAPAGKAPAAAKKAVKKTPAAEGDKKKKRKVRKET